MPRQAGLVGKPNTGKSTFFSAATLAPAKRAPYPFTTIEPNRGIAYVKVKCICRELGVKDNPKNSLCINGYRLIPVELIDVAGLVPDAWKGRGLGNKFLDELRRAEVLIHVVDASGGTDSEGRPVKLGSHDPCEDVRFLEREIAMWIAQILMRDWKRTSRLIEMAKEDLPSALAERLSGLQISRGHVAEALKLADLEGKKPSSWSEEDIMKFASELRKTSKPIIIAANKIDMPTARGNIEKMRREFKDYIIVPCSAEAELALRRAAEKGLIIYEPGSSDFDIVKPEKLTRRQMSALEVIREKVLKPWGSTGVQEVINRAFLELLEMIVVYPVEDANKLSDHDGNVLPDALLIKRGTTARQLAYKIHSDLGETFIYAINVRTNQRVGENYQLEMNDIIKIVAAMARK
ncbi:MAG: redox-regulated ATPase YchF [archaeon GB-1867-005]|nr:redox-regulated ATPase YchF [Candidatus Culexmicrobium cathedralense]